MSHCYIVCKSFLSMLLQLSSERLYMFATHNPASVTVNRGQVSLFCHSSIPLNTRHDGMVFIYVHNTATEAVCCGLPDGIPASQIRKTCTAHRNSLMNDQKLAFSPKLVRLIRDSALQDLHSRQNCMQSKMDRLQMGKRK